MKSNLAIVVSISACVGAALLAPAEARAEHCQNQALIDTCVFGCNAAEGVCGGLCDAANIVSCVVGCGTFSGVCDVVCFFDSNSGVCKDCKAGVTNCRNNCQADCDGCILNCESGCPDCRPFNKAGESCNPIDFTGELGGRCADGLVCRILPSNPGGSFFVCLPSEDDDLADDDACRAVYSSAVHQTAMDLGLALNFGVGAAAAVVAGVGIETGVVYGPDGKYGCYITECIGAETNIGIEVYASVGFYNSYSDFQGDAIAFIEEAGALISFSTSQVFSTDLSTFLGTADCLSLGVSVLPISVGVYHCTTIVDTAGCVDGNGNLIPFVNNPPVAVCSGADVCGDPSSCRGNASIDGGSFDPDGDVLTFTQVPAGPFGFGSHTVTLTVTDPSGASDSCTAQVNVIDCHDPIITCPSDTTLECDESTDPSNTGTAVASDACDPTPVVTHADSETGGSCPQQKTITRTWLATDATGNVSECTQTITVVDTTDPILSGVPADVTVECDAVPEPATPSATDNCDPSPTITLIEIRTDGDCADRYTLTRTWTAVDACGNSSSQSQTITVQDTTPPAVSGSVDVDELWPPRHDLVNVGLEANTADNCDSEPVISVLVFADEDDEDQTGDGHHSPDAKDIDLGTLRLRSERDGDQDGRVYLVVVTSTDGCGNEASVCRTVVVPLSRSKADRAAVNAQAAAAQAFCEANNGQAPSDFFPVGDGPVIGPVTTGSVPRR